MTNAFVLVADSSDSLTSEALVEYLKESGARYLDARSDPDVIPHPLYPSDGLNVIVVSQFPEDLQNAKTVYVGHRSPDDETSADLLIDPTEKTVSQIVAEIDKIFAERQDAENAGIDISAPLLRALWDEPHDDGMLALKDENTLVFTKEPTSPFEDGLIRKEVLRRWKDLCEQGLREVDKVDTSALPPAIKTVSDEAPAAPPKSARLKYLNDSLKSDVEESDKESEE